MEKNLDQSSSVLDDSGANCTNSIADAEAAALMARLGAQFGDLDMTQLGLGLGIAGGDRDNLSTSVVEAEIDKFNDEVEIESEESSLADPTPEELAAWQASQFNKGKEQQKREQQLLEERVRHGEEIASNVESGSILDILGGDQSAFFTPKNVELLSELTSNERHGDPEILQTSWKRLFASYEQGLGFLSMWNALRGYDGPTLMILRTLPSATKYVATPVTVRSDNSNQNRESATACIGFYTTTPWTENIDLFGGEISSNNDADRAFLFSIREHQAPNIVNDEENTMEKNLGRIKFFPVKSKEELGTGGGYMYCHPSTMPNRQNGNINSKNRSSTFAVNGIGVGGRPTEPRFHLTETFEDCRCLTYDSSRTTKDGDLFAWENDDGTHPFAQALYYFDVDEIEVWGVGGKEWIEHALKERESARKQYIKQYQTINKQMMWDEGTFAKGVTSSTASRKQR
eukprot:jgi/Psemu1/313185/fgenesh1_kg.1119_\